MHFTSAFLIVAGLASLATAFVYPERIPLHRRQEPGTPAYDCHANCGGVIQIARTENYCTSANFTTQLAACLNCANEFDIWQYYGESVTEAEQACGITAEPVAVNATTTAVVTPVSAASNASATDSAATTSGSEVSESAAGSTGGSASATATPTESASASAAAETSAAAGVKNVLGYGLAVLPIGAAVMALS